MRILKKLLVRIILLIVAAGILCGSVWLFLGYLMYRDALKEQNLEDKVAEVQADPSYTPLADLPEIYLDAVVAVEDHRFEQHCGVDIIAIARAAWNNIKSWSLRKAVAPSLSSLPRTCILPRSGVLSVRLRRFSWPFGWSRPTQRTRSWSCMSTPFTLATAITVSGTPARATLERSCGHGGGRSHAAGRNPKCAIRLLADGEPRSGCAAAAVCSPADGEIRVSWRGRGGGNSAKLIMPQKTPGR